MDVTSAPRQGGSSTTTPTPAASAPNASSSPAVRAPPFAAVLRAVKGHRPALGLREKGGAARPGFNAAGEVRLSGGETVHRRDSGPEDGSGSGSGGSSSSSGSAVGGDGGEGGEGDGEGAASAARKTRDDMADWLDPAARHAASLAPPLATPAAPIEPASAETGMRARSLEELLPALVRRIAWAGDRHRGTVRLELGAGAFAGTTVVVHAEGGRVRVELGGREGPDLDRLRARLDARLRGHGLDVESVT